MRIEAIRIDGYGIHSGLEIKDLPPGLTIVAGPNEAGKTTILDFIRGVLFDFPNRAKRTLPFHEPLRGGRHGGAVSIIDTLGRRWYLERHVGEKEPRLTNEEGEVTSPAMLSVLLGGANDALFRNVFAFGLGELASFSSLNSDEVRERVFSARGARCRPLGESGDQRDRGPDRKARQASTSCFGGDRSPATAERSRRRASVRHDEVRSATPPCSPTSGRPRLASKWRGVKPTGFGPASPS